MDGGEREIRKARAEDEPDGESDDGGGEEDGDGSGDESADEESVGAVWRGRRCRGGVVVNGGRRRWGGVGVASGRDGVAGDDGLGIGGGAHG